MKKTFRNRPNSRSMNEKKNARYQKKQKKSVRNEFQRMNEWARVTVVHHKCFWKLFPQEFFCWMSLRKGWGCTINIFFSNHVICVGVNHKLSDCSRIVWFKFKRYDFDMGMDAELGTDSDFFNVDYIWSGPIWTKVMFCTKMCLWLFMIVHEEVISSKRFYKEDGICGAVW